MIRVLRLNVLFLVFVLIAFSSVGQDILHLRKGGEKRIIFDAEDANSLTYRDYDDPDFKLVTERKKLYSKVVLANGKTIWLTQRDNYFRFRLGFNIGAASPIGDFASSDINNGNTGFTSVGYQFALNLDVNIYKFVGLRAMAYHTEGSDNSNQNYWYDNGIAIGPEFHIKLSPRFYTSIPILFQYKEMDVEYSSSYSFDGYSYGNGTGFITGLGMHARLGQHLAIGLTSQYLYQTMTMDFRQYSTNNPTNSNFTAVNTWSYLSNSVSFTIHF